MLSFREATLLVLIGLGVVRPQSVQDPKDPTPAQSVRLHIIGSASSEDWYDDVYEHAVGIWKEVPPSQMSGKDRRESHGKMLVEVKRDDTRRSMRVTVKSVDGRATSGAYLDFEFQHEDGRAPVVQVTGTWRQDLGPKSGSLSDIEGDVYVNQENVLANTLGVRFALRAKRTSSGSPLVLMGAYRVTE